MAVFAFTLRPLVEGDACAAAGDGAAAADDDDEDVAGLAVTPPAEVPGEDTATGDEELLTAAGDAATGDAAVVADVGLLAAADVVDVGADDVVVFDGVVDADEHAASSIALAAIEAPLSKRRRERASRGMVEIMDLLLEIQMSRARSAPVNVVRSTCVIC